MAHIAPALHSLKTFPATHFLFSASVCVSPVSKEDVLNLLKAW